MSANRIVVTTAGQLVAAMNNVATNDTTLISIENPGDDIIQLSSTLNIPGNFVGNSSRSLIIEGNGITIQPTVSFGSNIPLVKRNNGGSDIKNCSITIKNVNFDCRNYDMTGLELYTASNIVLENCRFNNCKTGVILANIDRAAITNCYAYNITAFGFIDNVIGASSDPPPLNTRCNNITYTNCKVTSLATSQSNIIGFYSYATSGIAYYECATQGRVGKCINFDSAGGSSTVAPLNVINNIQIRNFSAPLADTAMVDLYLADGFAKIDGLYITSDGTPVAGGMVIIDAKAYPPIAGEPNPHLYVENVPYLPQIAKFKTMAGIPAPLNCPATPPDDVVWEFKEIYDGQNIFSASRWYNGLIPYYRYAEFFNESKKILTDSISINNKFI